MEENKTILVVDDEPFNTEIILEILEDDYDVVEAENGHECLQILKQARENNADPDLILLDVNMPGIDGIEVCKQIRSDASYDAMPIIFVSALASEKEQLVGYEAGGNDYVSKPFSQKELKAKVALTLGKYEVKANVEKSTADTSALLMKNLTNTSEIGQVINFIQESYGHKSIDALIKSSFKLFSQLYGLHTSILFSNAGQNKFFFNTGTTRPLEKEVLTHIQKSSSRIVTFGKRVGFNSEKNDVTILVLNMPDDEEKAGRLRDHVIIFVDALALRLASLSNELIVVKQEKILSDLIKTAQVKLSEINQQKENQRHANYRNFEGMKEDIETLFMTIDMSDTQEEVIRQVIAKNGEKLDALSDENQIIELTFNQTMLQYLAADSEIN